MAIEYTNLGFITLEGFVRRDDVTNRTLKLCFICCGQYGGRQGDEEARLGHSVFVINTSESDLLDLKAIAKNSDRIIKLEGYGGAAKDIERGQAAIYDNSEAIVNVLQHEDVIDADHVFVVGGMGGGTGNAAIPMICSNLAKIRKPFNGKPSFGAIITVPASWEKRGIKKNALWGLGHLDQLVKNEDIGAIVLIDNDKLYNLTQGVHSNTTETPLNWMDYGNSSLAALLDEITMLTSLPSSKAFDLDEWRDVFSSPGWVSIGKSYITNSNEIDRSDKIFRDAFANSPTASDYDYELDTVNGFMAVIHPKNEIITDSSFKVLEEQFGDFIESAEKPHSGMIANHIWGKITSKNKLISEDKKAIVYTAAVSINLPDRVRRMLVEIEQEEEKLEKKRIERSDKKSLDLSSFTKQEDKVVKEKSSLGNQFDLFGSKTEEKEKNNNTFDLKLNFPPRK
ncbi:hypothetical protein [Paenibacillus sp. A3M_27_13]|uniref:hypothetical protein n=1 Tax=Paenibacillus sp. A3M_27_13 TaxID=2962029 RepID=UPI0020B8FC1C|nr:hypothetical protein [Paenibacillus sp. A3M_27_13]MCP3746653.1 hypothetical protein [Paenibacillus sp. A3M_27_13]